MEDAMGNVAAPVVVISEGLECRGCGKRLVVDLPQPFEGHGMMARGWSLGHVACRARAPARPEQLALPGTRADEALPVRAPAPEAPATKSPPAATPAEPALVEQPTPAVAAPTELERSSEPQASTSMPPAAEYRASVCFSVAAADYEAHRAALTWQGHNQIAYDWDLDESGTRQFCEPIETPARAEALRKQFEVAGVVAEEIAIPAPRPSATHVVFFVDYDVWHALGGQVEKKLRNPLKAGRRRASDGDQVSWAVSCWPSDSDEEAVIATAPIELGPVADAVRAKCAEIGLAAREQAAPVWTCLRCSREVLATYNPITYGRLGPGGACEACSRAAQQADHDRSVTARDASTSDAGKRKAERKRGRSSKPAPAEPVATSPAESPPPPEPTPAAPEPSPAAAEKPEPEARLVTVRIPSAEWERLTDEDAQALMETLEAAYLAAGVDAVGHFDARHRAGYVEGVEPLPESATTTLAEQCAALGVTLLRDPVSQPSTVVIARLSAEAWRGLSDETRHGLDAAVAEAYQRAGVKTDPEGPIWYSSITGRTMEICIPIARDVAEAVLRDPCARAGVALYLDDPDAPEAVLFEIRHSDWERARELVIEGFGPVDGALSWRPFSIINIDAAPYRTTSHVPRDMLAALRATLEGAGIAFAEYDAGSHRRIRTVGEFEPKPAPEVLEHEDVSEVVRACRHKHVVVRRVAGVWKRKHDGPTKGGAVSAFRSACRDVETILEAVVQRYQAGLLVEEWKSDPGAAVNKRRGRKSADTTTEANAAEVPS
jgi:hypothetical protein